MDEKVIEGNVDYRFAWLHAWARDHLDVDLLKLVTVGRDLDANSLMCAYKQGDREKLYKHPSLLVCNDDCLQYNAWNDTVRWLLHSAGTNDVSKRVLTGLLEGCALDPTSELLFISEQLDPTDTSMRLLLEHGAYACVGGWPQHFETTQGWRDGEWNDGTFDKAMTDDDGAKELLFEFGAHPCLSFRDDVMSLLPLPEWMPDEGDLEGLDEWRHCFDPLIKAVLECDTSRLQDLVCEGRCVNQMIKGRMIEDEDTFFYGGGDIEYYNDSVYDPHLCYGTLVELLLQWSTREEDQKLRMLVELVVLGHPFCIRERWAVKKFCPEFEERALDIVDEIAIPTRIDRHWGRVRNVARNVGKIALFVTALFEHTLSPGGPAEKRAKREFQDAAGVSLG